MKSYPRPAQFDGAKFAARYGLNSFLGDFFIAEGFIFVPENLPDDPPIFEAPDPPKSKVTIEDLLKRIEALELKVK